MNDITYDIIVVGGGRGHAGGGAASIAPNQNVPVKDIDIHSLRKKLKEQDAFIE